MMYIQMLAMLLLERHFSLLESRNLLRMPELAASYPTHNEHGKTDCFSIYPLVKL